MRIRQLDIDAFGGLRELASPPWGDFVVIQGRNEAGKTSLFEFLCSLLYGVYPASADRHPFAPWDGTELAGAARIELDDGTPVEVARRLRSAPSGTLAREGESVAIRNEDLPFVAHVPRRVFRQVHALRLPELALLEEEGWEAIQDRILGRLGATDLRSAREVADELLAEARALWRPDRRGSPRIRLLDEAIRELATRRPEVRERTARRREAAARLAEVRAVLESAREARRREQAGLDRLRILVPLRAELGRIAELRERAGDEEFLVGLPADPPAELARRRERRDAAASRLEEWASEAARLGADLDAFTDEDASLVDAAAEIDGFRARVAAAEPLRLRSAAAAQELRGVERRLRDDAEALPWAAGPDPDRLSLLTPATLHHAFGAWAEAWREASGTGVSTASAAPPTPSLAGIGRTLVTAGLGVAASAVLAWADLPPLGGASGAVIGGGALVGVLMAAIGARLLALDRGARESRRREDEADRRGRDARRAGEQAARESLRAILEPVGLAVPERPETDLPVRAERVRQLLRDRDDLRREVADLHRRLESVDAEGRELAHRAGLGAGDAAGTSALLHERLRAALERAEAHRRARARLEESEPNRESAAARLAEARADVEALEARLAALGPDPERGADEGARRLDALREARRRLDDLRAAHPDLDALRDEIDAARRAGEAWVGESDPLAARSAALERWTGEIEARVAEEKALEASLVVPEGEETLDEMEGESMRLRGERQRLREAHDRLWILSELVDEADRCVRDRHQPEILRHAGDHLRVLTGGRYDRLEVAPDRGRSLMVSGPAVPGAVEVAPPLSTGTREQIYVALRLALVDHLDDGAERLPFFLDEVLVNWDPERRRRGLDLLEVTARRRQVVLFTCHPFLVDEAVARGATPWRLEGP